MILLFWVLGFLMGVAFAGYFTGRYINGTYWDELTTFLDKRDEKIIQKLTKKQPQDHHEKNTA